MYAARRGNIDVLRMLLNRNADVAPKSVGDGFTALHLACGNELIEVAVELLKAGANPNVPDNVSIISI